MVDASVVAKWYAPEIDEQPALRLLELYQAGQVDLVAPHVLISEVGNVLWKKGRRGELTDEAVKRCFDQFLWAAPTVVDSIEVTRAAFRLALDLRHPIYDCLYLALALDRRCDLITADEKLYRSLQPTYSCMRLLRDFTAP